MKKGQVVSFRLPVDTPAHILDYLQNLKETETKHFSKRIAELLITGIEAAAGNEFNTVTVNQTLKVFKPQAALKEIDELDDFDDLQGFTFYREPEAAASEEIGNDLLDCFLATMNK